MLSYLPFDKTAKKLCRFVSVIITTCQQNPYKLCNAYKKG